MMKKGFWAAVCLCLAVALCCVQQPAAAAGLSVGDEIEFGRYEQDNNPDNGTEAILWQVLQVRDGKALLLSKYVLDNQPFNTEKKDTSWVSCSLRAWLNNEFLQAAFSAEEQAALLATEVANNSDEQNPAWYTQKLSSTTDKVSLLSYREVKAFFPEEGARKTRGTEYARSKGAVFLGITSFGTENCDWWLRSPGNNLQEAAYVGVVRDINNKGVGDKVGVRPMVWLDIGADRSFFPEARFKLAENYQYRGLLDDAANIYETLGDYRNSHNLAKDCRAQQAQKAMDSGEYATALRLYESLEGYGDSYLQGRAARYALAVQTMEAGDYKTAAQMFEKAGQYQDSMARLRTCYEKQGILWTYMDAEAVEAGGDGYREKRDIQQNDKHYHWRMGRFFVSGYTRETAGQNDAPVFIKNLGDSVTLWFDLEQDIEALNGNTNLKLHEDGGGYDFLLKTQKTDLGRGALFVRSTDYRKDSNTQTYTNYLLAKGTSGADTKVVLHEEGDYEIALDYELVDNDITHITSKYSNYRIFIKFSVRNGNCMVYPFDVVTGAELQNTSITENGFRLDLARSRYLDINVVRTVMVEGPTGYTEDVRYNRPASDGEQYTAEGIYTISVKNNYTGESTVKTIFVGTQDLLEQYVQHGFSKDRLN